MPTDPIKIGAGTSYAYSTDGTTFVTVAKIQKITAPKTSVAKVSTDTFDSATTASGNPIEDQISGWVTPGDWSFQVISQKTVYNTLRGKVADTTLKHKIIKSDGSGYTFAGYISSIGDDIPLKELVTYTMSVQITGGLDTFATTQS